MEINSPEVGIITAGISYHYAKDVFPEYSYLKLGMVYPLPVDLIREFAARVKKSMCSKNWILLSKSRSAPWESR